MKAILINTLALLIASFVCCNADETPSLKAEIKNAKSIAGSKSAISLDFVLTNLTEKPILLAERWNSWGAYQWSFLLTDKAGDRFVFSNPQNVWACNFLDVFTIAPKESHTMKCKLMMDRTSDPEENFSVFLPSSNSERNNEGQITKMKMNGPWNAGRWQYPVRLVGYFSASKIHKMNDNPLSTNWTGSISSSAVNIEKAEPADGKTPEVPQTPR